MISWYYLTSTIFFVITWLVACGLKPAVDNFRLSETSNQDRAENRWQNFSQYYDYYLRDFSSSQTLASYKICFSFQTLALFFSLYLLSLYPIGLFCSLHFRREFRVWMFRALSSTSMALPDKTAGLSLARTPRRVQNRLPLRYICLRNWCHAKTQKRSWWVRQRRRRMIVFSAPHLAKPSLWRKHIIA